jgi:uncharacterized RDD family membrane protein YckC
MSENKDQSDSPLERYLKKQQKDQPADQPADQPLGAGPSQGGASSSEKESTARSLPPAPDTEDHSPESGPISAKAKYLVRPAGFWVRVGASIVDGLILGVVDSIGRKFFGLLIAIPSFSSSDFSSQGWLAGILFSGFVLNWVVMTFLNGFFFAWFYNQKGASPGKMVFDLKVVDATSGKYLSIPQAFFRETVGKLISGVLTLGFGYLMVAFSGDRRGLHDRLFNTRVVQVLGKSQK